MAFRSLFRSSFALVLGSFLLTNLSGCVMKEEIKRIEQVQQMQKQRDMAGSTNLTGEQIFMRSCNTCHPGGQAGMGPTLEKMGEHFPEDQALKAFIRKGKGIMPGQPKDTINDEELDSLVTYLRGLTFDK